MELRILFLIGALALTSPVTLPLLVALTPALLTGFSVLVGLQILAPASLPGSLREFDPLTSAAAAITSAIRNMRESFRRTLSRQGWPEPGLATTPVVDPTAAMPPPPMPTVPVTPYKEKYELEDVGPLEAEGRYDELIIAVQQLVARDSTAALAHPSVKRWLGRRFRNLFLQFASLEPNAVSVASRREGFFGLSEDSRPVAQRLAERFLKLPLPTGNMHGFVHEWQQVAPPVGSKEVSHPDLQGVTPLPRASQPDLSKDSLPDGNEAEAMTLLFVPGIITGMLPVREFVPEMSKVQARTGVRTIRALVHPLRGSQGNVADILAALERNAGASADPHVLLPVAPEPLPPPPESVVIVAYSKGMSDVLEFLLAHPEWQKKVKCVYSWAGVVGGSPLADNVYSSVRSWDFDKVLARVDEVLEWICPIINLRKGNSALSRIEEMDIKGAIRDITVEHRQAWLADKSAQLQALRIPIFCVTASCLAADCAYFNASGWMLLNLHDSANDMQVTQGMALVHTPLSTHLAVLNANHWDISFGTFPVTMTLGSRKLVHHFPKQAGMTAMLALVREIGLA